ncbi:MAG TPA: PaaI family thioesterase [Candidatus Thermoplasmatota archaeon]|nr:PaaI family thioesterase [Candidatus Thermoplasmatota archaeon]
MSTELDVSVLDGLIRHPPFHQWLGVTVASAEKGRVVLALPPNPEFVGNPFIPAVHGGIVAALIDLAGGAALFVELRFPTPTIDMRVDYLRPAIAGKRLLAEARVKSLGKTVAFVDIDVTDEEGRLVATGRCAYSVKDQEKGPRGFPIG